MMNGNGMTIMTAKWVLGVAQVAMISMMLWIVTNVVAMKESQAVMTVQITNLDEKINDVCITSLSGG